MACEVQNWNLKDVAAALNERQCNGKRIAVPLFQRGKRWKPEQKLRLIDSLMNGYPVGTLLFHKRVENSEETYILVDGLQRASTIREYIENPTRFFIDNSIPEEFCSEALTILGKEPSNDNVCAVVEALNRYILGLKSYSNIQYIEPALEIVRELGIPSGIEMTEAFKLQDALKKFFNDKQSTYETIDNSQMPIVVYNGDEKTLDEIFERINSSGTPLSRFEVYSAAWPTDRRFKINNRRVVEAVVKKYEKMGSDGLALFGYDKAKILETHELTAFEYVFGLGKHLHDEYDMFRLEKAGDPTEVAKFGFELVNACLNNSDKIRDLYRDIYAMQDVNGFEKALTAAIDYVKGAIACITQFKGNSQKQKKPLHSKFQIMSMVASTFRKMYPEGDYSKQSDGWKQEKGAYEKRLREYYVFDIFCGCWSDGGTGKIFLAPGRYEKAISSGEWASALNSYYEGVAARLEKTPKKVSHASPRDLAFLNCVYAGKMTAWQQNSTDLFDIEHIAAKKILADLNSMVSGQGLAISSIANLCYLPQSLNRKKGASTIYDANLSASDLKQVEDKYTFTVKSDLDWTNATPPDYAALKAQYDAFCVKRFAAMEKIFRENLGLPARETPSPTPPAPNPANNATSYVSAPQNAAPSSVQDAPDGGNAPSAGDGVGAIAKYWIPKLVAEKLNAQEVAWLTTQAAKQHFGVTESFPLLELGGRNVQLTNNSEHPRYYSLPEPIVFGGKQYALSSQWREKGRAPLLAWLRGHGAEI